MGLCKYRGGKGPCPYGDSALAKGVYCGYQMHLVTIIEMSKASGTGTFLWGRGSGHERIYFWCQTSLWIRAGGGWL